MAEAAEKQSSFFGSSVDGNSNKEEGKSLKQTIADWGLDVFSEAFPQMAPMFKMFQSESDYQKSESIGGDGAVTDILTNIDTKLRDGNIVMNDMRENIIKNNKILERIAGVLETAGGGKVGDSGSGSGILGDILEGLGITNGVKAIKNLAGRFGSKVSPTDMAGEKPAIIPEGTAPETAVAPVETAPVSPATKAATPPTVASVGTSLAGTIAEGLITAWGMFKTYQAEGEANKSVNDLIHKAMEDERSKYNSTTAQIEGNQNGQYGPLKAPSYDETAPDIYKPHSLMEDKLKESGINDEIDAIKKQLDDYRGILEKNQDNASVQFEYSQKARLAAQELAALQEELTSIQQKEKDRLGSKDAKTLSDYINNDNYVTNSMTDSSGSMPSGKDIGDAISASGMKAYSDDMTVSKSWADRFNPQSSNGPLGMPPNLGSSGRRVGTGQLKKNQQESFDYLVGNKKLDPELAKIFIGDTSGESLADPSNKHWDRTHYSQGIVQWDDERSAAIKKQFGKLPSEMSINEQWDAMLWEIQKDKPELWKELHDPNVPRNKKMYDLVHDYERPANPVGDTATRLGYVEGLGDMKLSNTPADRSKFLQSEHADRNASEQLLNNPSKQLAHDAGPMFYGKGFGVNDDSPLGKALRKEAPSLGDKMADSATEDRVSRSRWTDQIPSTINKNTVNDMTSHHHKSDKNKKGDIPPVAPLDVALKKYFGTPGYGLPGIGHQ